MLYFYCTLIAIIWIFILLKEFQRNKLGKTIISIKRDINKISYISTGIFFLIFSITQYINLDLFKASLGEQLISWVGIISFIAIYLYFGIRKSQIKEFGIWTPLWVKKWDEINSYRFIDYKKYNETYEGKYYGLRLTKNCKFLRMKWNKKYEIDIQSDKVDITKDFLEIKYINSINK